MATMYLVEVQYFCSFQAFSAFHFLDPNRGLLVQVPVQEDGGQKTEPLPQSNSTTNWTINVSDVSSS